MSDQDFKALSDRLDRIEKLLAQVVGVPVESVRPAGAGDVLDILKDDDPLAAIDRHNASRGRKNRGRAA